MIDEMMIHGAFATRRKAGRIETDTPIVPSAIASAVREEASVWLEEELPQAWIGS